MNKTGEPVREQPRRYRSRVDALLIVALLGAPLALFMSLGSGLLGLPLTLRLATLLPLVGLFCLLAWTLLATHYTIDEYNLTVRSGPFRWVIALSQIESVTPTRDARSGPALSLDRLRICYGGGRQMLISPQEKEAFIRDLERRLHIVLDAEPTR